MIIEKELKDCFKTALKDEEKNRKHKGLLIVGQNQKEAEGYIIKAKKNLELCELYKERGFDYKIPEEWFYTLYYCALAILAKIGVETRSQKYTALFLRYLKEKRLIEYEDEFINRIIVYKEKDKKSDVDEREKARYSSALKIKEVSEQYEKMMELCKKAVSQCEDIIFLDKDFILEVKKLLEEKWN